jgi:hypothetical protein
VSRRSSEPTTREEPQPQPQENDASDWDVFDPEDFADFEDEPFSHDEWLESRESGRSSRRGLLAMARQMAHYDPDWVKRSPHREYFEKLLAQYGPGVEGIDGFNGNDMVFEDAEEGDFFPYDWNEMTPAERRAAEDDCLEIARSLARFAPGSLAHSPYREHYEQLLTEYGWEDDEEEVAP